MRIVLITDTHWGIRGDSEFFHDASKKFLDETFFPYLKEHKIDTVIHGGDLVDRRKYINFNTLKRLKEDFLNPLSQLCPNIHIIIGNHDTYFKNTNSVNSVRELVDKRYNIKYYESTEEVLFDGLKILFVPWICSENREETFAKIRETDAQICIGHLELAGFQMYKGNVSHHGDDPTIFNKFDLVFSGHFHHRSNDGHIFYLGTHGEFTWADYNDPRGFHCFDTETRELTFIENPYKIFNKLVYDDLNNEIDDNSNCANKIIKIVVKNKNDVYLFDKYVEAVEKQNPIELQIVEDTYMELITDEHVVDEAMSTVDIFKSYIESSNIPSDIKTDVEKKIIQIYQESLSLE